MNLRFVVRLLLAVLATLVFRLALGSRLAIAGVQPDLTAALVFYVTLARGAVTGIVCGTILGLLVDVDRPGALGLSSLAWSTLAYLTARLAEAVDASDPILSTGLLILVVAAAETIRALFVSGGDPSGFGLTWIRWALPTALYTGIAVPILVAAAHWVLRIPRWLE